MEIFGNAFIEMRNKYVIPLIHYGVDRKKCEFWDLKDILTENIMSFNKISSNLYEIEVPKDEFMKALMCDIEMFFNKSVIQYMEHQKMYKNESTWSFVTAYYFLFFSSTAFTRLLHRGFIFLSQEQIKRIELFSLAVYSSVIKINPGNYYFSVKDSTTYGNLIVTINYKGEGIHKMTLIQLETILNTELLPFADKDESVFISHLIKAIRAFNSEFPSTLRNQLNYSGESCFLDLESSLPSVKLSNITKNFKDEVLKLDLAINDRNKFLYVHYYAVFIFNYVCKLYEEYKTRSKFGKDFQKERSSLTRNITIFE